MVESLFNKVAGLRAASILHLLIIFTQKAFSQEVLNGKKDTIKITAATNCCLENSQFYCGIYWKSDFQFFKS